MLNNELFLPSRYLVRREPDYYNDALDDRAGTLFQPEIYPAAEALLTSTGRTRIVDVGCGRGSKLSAANAGRKLGVDFGSNIVQCRNDFPEEMARGAGKAFQPSKLERYAASVKLIHSDAAKLLDLRRTLL